MLLLSRLSRLLAAPALSVSVIAFAAPPTTQSPPAPVPVPYPNAAARDSANGLATGKRMYKPVASSTSSADPAAQQPASCATNAQPTSQVASDPEEGGQITKAGKTTGKVSIHSFNFTHKMDKSSPMMMDDSPHPGDCR